MPYCKVESITVTTDGAGAATAYTNAVNGILQQIRYVKTDYAAGVDFTITNETTGETIWSQLNVDASVTVAPRQPTSDTAGVASLYAAGGEPVEDKIAIAGHRIKIVIASGGATKSGTFYFILS